MATGGYLISNQDENYLMACGALGLFSNCHIESASTQQDGQGGFTRSNLISYLNVPCRLMQAGQVPGGDNDERGGKIGRASQEFFLTVHASQPLSESDSVWVDGENFEVLSVNTERTISSTRRARVRKL